MKTLTLQEPHQFKIHETESPNQIPDGMALVQTKCVGICGTDIHAFHGTQPFFSYPRILGHELGVEVMEVAANDMGIQTGSRCAVEPYMNCGTCIACKRGKQNCCEKIQVMGVHQDGGMRDQFLVPIHKLHSSNTLSFDQLALVETLGIGKHAVNRAQLEQDEWVLIIGAGPIGLTVVEFARIAGANIIVMDINEDRLSFCQDQMNVKHTVHASGNIDAYCRNLMGHLPTTVFDCTGNKHSMQQANKFVANGGQLVFVGLYIGELVFTDQEIHKQELTLKRCRNSLPTDMKEIIQLMEAGKINTSTWITHRTDIGGSMALIPELIKPETKAVKAIIEWDA
jgi:2-desacetyl-2-hydroxyethyl bacteriochlorophyllide A dehydrogenase